jgi:hypothetical protein
MKVEIEQKEIEALFSWHIEQLRYSKDPWHEERMRFWNKLREKNPHEALGVAP